MIAAEKYEKGNFWKLMTMNYTRKSALRNDRHCSQILTDYVDYFAPYTLNKIFSGKNFIVSIPPYNKEGEECQKNVSAWIFLYQMIQDRLTYFSFLCIEKNFTLFLCKNTRLKKKFKLICTICFGIASKQRSDQISHHKFSITSLRIPSA